MKSKGFSLLELSIVLVIIGLIAGGIVAGSAMIRAAELRSIITNVEQFKVASNNFRDKYLALPGDMKNAVRFWGAAAGATADGIDAACAALDDTSPSTGTETCNGDGSGIIGGTVAETYERFRLWQHLANANLINGTYTGVHGAAGINDPEAGENVPEGKTSGSIFYLRGFISPIAASNTTYFEGILKHVVMFGASSMTGFESASTTGMLTAEELWNIDKKLDDGQPGTGSVLDFKNGYHASCSVDAENYDLAGTASDCVILFNKSF